MGIFDRQKMRDLRERLELTQEQAAKRAGIKTRQAWNNVENGDREPSLPTLERIAKALGVKPKDLLK